MLTPNPGLGFLPAAAALLAVIVMWLLRRWYRRGEVRRFLNQPIAASYDREIFAKPKSLLDILIDLGVSRASLEYVAISLRWIASKGRLRHRDLNAAVAATVSRHGRYERFILASKAHLQGSSPTELPTARSSPIGQESSTTTTKSGGEDVARFREQVRQLRPMMEALCDDTKLEIARKLRYRLPIRLGQRRGIPDVLR